jgi:undecaprenyl-diphosphatase
MVGLIVLLGAAVSLSGTVDRIDLAVVTDVHASAPRPVTDAILAVTTLGATHTILLVTAVALAALAAARRWRGALMLALSIATTEVTVALAKELVSRPRPPAGDAVTQAQGFSFPSGHAAAAMALYATLAYLGVRRCGPGPRIAIMLAAGLVVLAVGASRVYLGAHYPTDVLAGWLLGGTLALASWLAITRLRSPRAPLASI